MKLLAIIFSFYFLVLNVMPCSDIDDCKNDSQIVTVIDIDGDQHQDWDLCSPFCQCHCCHVHTINFGLVAFEPQQPLISYEFFAYFANLGKDIPHSLLQPPRV